jgi:hypothetical protein
LWVFVLHPQLLSCIFMGTMVMNFFFFLWC